MRTSTSLFVLPEGADPVLMAIVAPFFELRSRLAVFCHLVNLEGSRLLSALGQSAVGKRQGGGWQGGFLVPCLERGESE